MPHSCRRHSADEPISKELLLGIANDLQAVTERIAEIKELCEWQLSDLADAALAAAGAREWLSGNPATAIDPAFLAMVEEMAQLHARLDSHVAAGRNLANEFLTVARAVEQEFEFIRRHAGERARLMAEAQARDAAAGQASVISLQAQRAARSGSDAVRQRAMELSQSLRDLQRSVAVLFRAQAQSGTDVASLRVRLQAYQRRLAASRG
jgi:hypothetical protein